MRSLFRNIVVASIAVIAFGAFAAASASATSGPEWIVKGAALEAGKAQAIKLSNVNAIHINQTIANWECTSESSTGEMTGGNPGSGAGTIAFKECHLEGNQSCVLSSVPPIGQKIVPGEVKFAVKTVLAYPVGGTTEALEALVPAGTSAGANVFATLAIEGETCGTLKGQKGLFTAHGTEIKEPAFNKRCGFLTRVGQIKAGAFATLAAEAQATEGALNFPVTPITKGELYSPATKLLKEITCEAQLALGGSSVSVNGLLKVETSPTVELFGWKV